MSHKHHKQRFNAYSMSEDDFKSVETSATIAPVKMENPSENRGENRADKKVSLVDDSDENVDAPTPGYRVVLDAVHNGFATAAQAMTPIFTRCLQGMVGFGTLTLAGYALLWGAVIGLLVATRKKEKVANENGVATNEKVAAKETIKISRDKKVANKPAEESAGLIPLVLRHKVRLGIVAGTCVAVSAAGFLAMPLISKNAKKTSGENPATENVEIVEMVSSNSPSDSAMPNLFATAQNAAPSFETATPTRTAFAFENGIENTTSRAEPEIASNNSAWSSFATTATSTTPTTPTIAEVAPGAASPSMSPSIFAEEIVVVASESAPAFSSPQNLSTQTFTAPEEKSSNESIVPLAASAILAAAPVATSIAAAPQANVSSNVTQNVPSSFPLPAPRVEDAQPLASLAAMTQVNATTSPTLVAAHEPLAALTTSISSTPQEPAILQHNETTLIPEEPVFARVESRGELRDMAIDNVAMNNVVERVQEVRRDLTASPISENFLPESTALSAALLPHQSEIPPLIIAETQPKYAQESLATSDANLDTYLAITANENPVTLIASMPNDQSVAHEELAPRPRAGTFYRAQAADNFWTIAAEAYGSGKWFRELAEYNRDRVTSAAQIVGAIIEIPTLANLTAQGTNSAANQIVANSYQASPFAPIPAAPVNNVSANHSILANNYAANLAAPFSAPSPLPIAPLGSTIYLAQSGDTWESIAQAKLGSRARVLEIKRINPRLENSNIAAGTEIYIPLPQTRSAAAYSQRSR